MLFGCPGRPSCGSKPLNRHRSEIQMIQDIQGLHISRSLMTSLAPTASPWKAFAISGAEVHGGARRSRSPEARLSGCCLRCATLLHRSQTLDRPLYPPPEARRTADAGEHSFAPESGCFGFEKGIGTAWIPIHHVLSLNNCRCVAVSAACLCYSRNQCLLLSLRTPNSTSSNCQFIMPPLEL